MDIATIVNKAFTPEIIIWVLIILLIVGSKFTFGLNYISVVDIIKNHLKCFKNSNNKVMVVPILNYFGVPILLAIVATMKKTIDADMINIVTIIVSILTAMLFTLLTMIIDMKSKIKDDPNYFSTQAEISKKSLIESYYTVVFEILVSIILLVLCLLNFFTQSFNHIQSFLIYALTFILIINLLMITKRIFRVIDTDMNK